MQGFSRRHTVAQALEWLDAQVSPLSAESVPLRAAAGRVLASPVVSGVDVPGFDRATMDGYALVAEATDGATAYNRITFRVIGDAMPGAPFTGTVTGNDAVRIMTGAPVPAGSNAVLPAELVESRDPGSGIRDSGSGLGDPKATSFIDALASVSPGKNIGARGEDIVVGTELLPLGRVLRPQDLGVLSSIGHAEATVISHEGTRRRGRIIVSNGHTAQKGVSTTK